MSPLLATRRSFCDGSQKSASRAVRQGRTEKKGANWRTPAHTWPTLDMLLCRGCIRVCCCTSVNSDANGRFSCINTSANSTLQRDTCPECCYDQMFEVQAIHAPVHGFTGTSLIQNDAATIGAEGHFVVATKLKNITMKFLADKVPKQVYMKTMIRRKA